MKGSSKFTESTKRISAKMAGERCSICEELTSLPNKDRTDFINKGEAAHIYGANPSSNNRFSSEKTQNELKHISNCIWLCNNCHKHVDSDESEYTVILLKSLRELHFQRVVNGKYGRSSFKEIDILNMRISQLETQAQDRQNIIKKSERLFDLELHKLNVEKSKLENEKQELLIRYDSLLQSTLNIESNIVDCIHELIFQEGDFDKALKILDERELKIKEYEVAKNRVLKGEIYSLKGDHKNALFNYHMAFNINNSFEIASFLIRHLKSIKEHDALIEVIEKTIIEESKILNRPEKMLTLKGYLAQVYSKVDPNKSIELFKECLVFNEAKLKKTSNYLLKKASYLNCLAKAYMRNGELDKALSYSENSLNVFLTGKVESESLEDSFLELCSLYNTIAQIYELNKNGKEALKYYSLALKISQKQLPNNLHLRVVTILNMSDCHSKSNFSETMSLLNEAISNIQILLEKKPLSYFEMLIGAYCKKSDLLLHNGKLKEAENELKNAERILNQASSINETGFYVEKGNFLNRKAIFYLSIGEKEKAFKLMNSSIDAYETSTIKDRSVLSKTATLLLFRSSFHSNKMDKINDLSKAMNYLKSITNIYNSDILLLKRIEFELENVV